MTANDTATRRVTTGIVLAVGLFAGSDSYSHIYTLARDHGQAIASATLLPLAGDGLRRRYRRRRQRRRSPGC